MISLGPADAGRIAASVAVIGGVLEADRDFASPTAVSECGRRHQRREPPINRDGTELRRHRLAALRDPTSGYDHFFNAAIMEIPLLQIPLGSNGESMIAESSITDATTALEWIA